MEDYELENWIGISSLRTLEMYFVRRAAVEDEYSTGLASLSSPLPCLSTTVAVDAHRAIASTCSQISLKMHSLRTQYKKSLYELSVQQRIFIKPFQDLESKKIAALKKDMFKKFSLWEQSEKDGSLGKSVKLLAEFKTADLLYRKGIQQLEDVKSEYATFIRNCIDTMTTFETNRLTLTRDSLSSFSVEENYRIMQLINDSPPNETLNIEQELEKSTTILKQTFSIPQVIYEHPQYTTQLKRIYT